MDHEVIGYIKGIPKQLQASDDFRRATEVLFGNASRNGSLWF